MATSYYESFIKKLKEIFMMDHAELDFGIYRIMNQKRSDIQDFLISNTDYKEVSFWASRPEFTDSHVVFQNNDNYLDIMFENILE